MDSKSSTIKLNIPDKTLEDNFKLKDFQNDFEGLLKLCLQATSKPKTIKFNNMSGMTVKLDDGRVLEYKFERRTGVQISKIINLTENKETLIEW